MDLSRTARIVVPLLLLAAVGAAVPASAVPRNVRVVGVYLARDCAADICDPSVDTPLADGAVVTGEVQVFVHAEADLGLEWVRLEGQFGNDPRWWCLEWWNAQRATTFDSYRRWDTIRWTDPRQTCTPGNCSSCIENSPHKHGARTHNGLHTLRLVAREQGKAVSNEDDVVSKTTGIDISNGPTTAPKWLSDPAVASGDSPAVTLQWKPSPDKDIVEYHFLRENPDGGETEFALSAHAPQDQGCSKVGSIAFRCVDHGLEASGTYRYALVAYRAAETGKRCALTGKRCLASPLSEIRDATVSVSAAAPSPTTTKKGGGGKGEPSSAPTTTASDAPVAIHDVAQGEGQIARAGAKSPASSTPYIPIALALIALGGAGFALRTYMLRAR